MKFDLDKLSYKTYGNITILSIIILACLFCFIPFSLNNFIYLPLYTIEIPIYLFVRGNLKDPIHAIGLNICYVLTLLFYIMLFFIIKLSINIIGSYYVFIISSLINIIGCYFTSTVPNKKEEKGKLFFGKKPEEGKYKLLYEFMKHNYNDPRILKYEQFLLDTNMKRYNIFQATFRDFRTREDVCWKFFASDDLHKLYKELDAIYSTLEYSLGLNE